MTLREKLARLKAERGLTTEALSARSGVPRGTLNKILNGETRNPTIATLAALADALDCPLESLSTRAVDVPQPARAPSDIPGVYRLRDLAREAPQGQARDAGGAALPALPVTKTRRALTRICTAAFKSSSCRESRYCSSMVKFTVLPPVCVRSFPAPPGARETRNSRGRSRPRPL